MEIISIAKLSNNAIQKNMDSLIIRIRKHIEALQYQLVTNKIDKNLI